MPKRHNDDDVWNCQVCGRLRNHNKDIGHHIYQGGGYACCDCGKWAEKLNLKCPTCGGNLIHGDYHDKCTCDTPPRVTRSGRNFEIKG